MKKEERGVVHGAQCFYPIRLEEARVNYDEFLHGVARIFSNGGHTVSKGAYSPDFHVVYASCCRLLA